MHGTSSDHRLAAHEAEALWRAWSVNHDKSARDRLVLAYSPMVNYLASRKVRELPPHCELDDLVSYGLVALIEAVDRFNPAKGASFEQYAWTRVAGALMDELRRQDWASRSVRRRARQIEQERDAFYGREGVMPDDVQLADAMAIEVDELRMVLSEAGRAELVSLHAPARTTDEPATVEVIDTIASSASTETRRHPSSAASASAPSAPRSRASPSASATSSPSSTCTSSPALRSAGCSR